MSEKKEQKEELNLVKKTCRELGITQKELAEKIGMSERAVSNWANGKVKIPNNFTRMIELLKNEQELLEIKKVLKNALR
jgi:transcriptional regulator with XRE-family HTH domain